MPTAKQTRRRTGFPVTFHNKLVRDGIPRELRRKKLVVRALRVTHPPRLLDLLFAKIREEIAELEEAARAEKPRRKKIAEESGDVSQVLRDLARHLGVRWPKVKAARLAKLRERGGFREGTFLVSVRERKQKTVGFSG